MPGPIKAVRVPKSDQVSFQNYIRDGLRRLGIAQKDLAREYGKDYKKGLKKREEREKRIRAGAYVLPIPNPEYQWIRNHLKKSDPHFTYEVALALFTAVIKHPRSASQPIALKTWYLEARAQAALRAPTQYGALVAPAAGKELAAKIAKAIVVETRIPATRIAEVEKAVAGFFQKEGRELAYQFALLFGHKLHDLYGETLTLPFDVFNQTIELAWDYPMLLAKPEAQ